MSAVAAPTVWRVRCDANAAVDCRRVYYAGVSATPADARARARALGGWRCDATTGVDTCPPCVEVAR